MAMNEGRPGRPRDYDIAPAPGFANTEAAFLVGGLDELHERLFDLISDVPTNVLDAVPEGANNSMAMLCRHMTAAEGSWIASVARASVPAELRELYAGGSQDDTGELPTKDAPADAAQLIEAATRLREKFTKTVLAPLSDIDAEVQSGDRTLSVRGVLLNQLWHWTYHTGQVGMLRRMVGERYRWAYGDRIATKRP